MLGSNKIGLMIASAVLAIFTSVASAQQSSQQAPQQSILSKAIDDALDNFVMLNTSVGTRLTGVDDTNQLSLGVGISLQAPDITAKSYASTLSANGGFAFDLIDGDLVDAGLGAGLRGSLDLQATDSLMGFTPTVGGRVWIGSDDVGVMAESSIGVLGPLQGWQGSATLTYNIVDNVPSPFVNEYSGFSELLIGASASFIDETYARTMWSREDGTSTPATGLESIAVGVIGAFDFDGGWRVSVPVEVKQYFGSAADYFGPNGALDVSAGVSVGYRFD